MVLTAPINIPSATGTGTSSAGPAAPRPSWPWAFSPTHASAGAGLAPGLSPSSSAVGSPPPLPAASSSFSSFRRYSEKVARGAAPALPACPRRPPRPGSDGWRGFPRHDGAFRMCPDCYASVFAGTEYSHHLVPVAAPPPDVRTPCDFGASPWFHVAWFMTNKYRLPDLQLLRGVADALAANPPCAAGPARRLSLTRAWVALRDPSDRSGSTAPDFAVCPACASAVKALFPNLAPRLPLRPPARPSRQQPPDPFFFFRLPPEQGRLRPALHPDRRRFLLYLDMLETASDRGAAAAAAQPGAGVDVPALARRVRLLAAEPECARDRDVTSREWHFMRSFPQFTVCKDCFDHVVMPEIEAQNPLACRFYSRAQPLERAACQLYSPRMRRAFADACRADAFDRLGAVVVERRDVELDIRGKIRRGVDPPRGGETAKRVEEVGIGITFWSLFFFSFSCVASCKIFLYSFCQLFNLLSSSFFFFTLPYIDFL